MLYLSHTGALRVPQCCLFRLKSTFKARDGSTQPRHRQHQPRCLRHLLYLFLCRLVQVQEQRPTRFKVCAAGVTSGRAVTTPSPLANSPLLSCRRRPTQVRPCRRAAGNLAARQTRTQTRRTPAEQRSLGALHTQIPARGKRRQAWWTRSARRMRLSQA